MTLQQHPLSAAFPAMSADEYQALVDSIVSIGVQNPVTLYEGMVIDGWHRYTAAKESSMDCPQIELGDVDPRDFVLAQNKARRNLTASQRAAAVTSVYAWHPAGKPCINQRSSNSAPGADLPKTTKQLAAIAGTGTRTIEQAKVAHKAGLTDAVKAGAITVKEAAKIATGKPEKPAEKIVKPAVVEPDTQAPPDYSDLDAAQDQISDLQADLVVARMGNIPEEDKQQAATHIAELRAEVKTLTATLKAVTLSRDSLMEEAAELKRQCLMNMRELKKLRKE